MLLGEEHGIDLLLDASKLPHKNNLIAASTHVRVRRLASGSWCNAFRNSIHWSIDPINSPSQKQLPHRLKRRNTAKYKSYGRIIIHGDSTHCVLAASLVATLLHIVLSFTGFFNCNRHEDEPSVFFVSLFVAAHFFFVFYRWIPRPSRLSPPCECKRWQNCTRRTYAPSQQQRKYL